MPKHEIAFLIFSYLVGAIPFGYILFFLTDKKDIRMEGSGNIGATNMMRTKGKLYGILTLALDMFKGMAPILYGVKHFDSSILIICGGCAAILGHLFSIYLKFRGGKGVATFLGLCLVFKFPVILVFVGGFLTTYYFTRYVSASSIVGVSAVFIVYLFTSVAEVAMVIFLMILLIIVKHQGNIKRIIDGTEPKLIWKKNG